LVKVLPPGASVNLNLGADPFDRLLKTIQVASQVQGAFNQAQLQRDKREAIKEESYQTMMLNSMKLVDNSDIDSVSKGEEFLKQTRDRFVSENPELSDRADAFYTTILSTAIEPVKKTHSDFNQSQNEIMTGIDKMNNMILGVDGSGNYVFDGTEQEFKDEFTKASKLINRYNSKAAEYNSVIPDANMELAENTLGLRSVLEKLPSDLIGLFDESEKMLYSQLLKGEITEASFNAAIQAHYNKTTGRALNQTMPLLGNEMKSLYLDSYMPIHNIYNQIEKNEIPLSSSLTLPQQESVKTYIDDSRGDYTYVINDTKYDVGTAKDLDTVRKQWDLLTEEEKKVLYNNSLNLFYAKIKTLDLLDAQKQNIIREIDKKDVRYKELNAGATGQPTSYASQLESDGKWLWEKTDETLGGDFTFGEDIIEDKIVPEGEKEIGTNIVLKNKEDFSKLGIEVPDNLTQADLDKMSEELLEIFNNTPDGNFVKLQSITRASQALSNAQIEFEENIVTEEPVAQPTLTNKQLAQAEKEFKQFQVKLKKQISNLSKDIEDKKKKVNKLTSFNKESLVKRKNEMNIEIQNLENQLKQSQDALENTDIDTWFNTISKYKFFNKTNN
jgi:hypothetical protein